VGPASPALSRPRISGGRGCRGERERGKLGCVSFRFRRRRSESGERAEKDENVLASRHDCQNGGGANRRILLGTRTFPPRSWCFVSRETGGVDARAGSTYLTQRDSAFPVDVVHCALPGGRVPEGDDNLLPEQGLGKSGSEPSETIGKRVRARSIYLPRVGGRGSRERGGDAARGEGMTAEFETRVTHLEIRRVQPRKRLLVRRALREARGSREGAGQMSDGRVSKASNEKKQRARARRKRARVRVSADETTHRLPRAHLAHLHHRHRVYRGLSLRYPRVLASHRPFATDAFASCKLKSRTNDAAASRMARRRVRRVRDRSIRALSRRSDQDGLPDRPVRFSRRSPRHPSRTRAMTGASARRRVSVQCSDKIFFHIRQERLVSAGR